MASSSRTSTNQSDLLKPNEYKVILIGDVGVGKTSLLMRYVYNSFEETTTKFISEEKKDITINGQNIVLHLWDTAGQDRFRTLTQRYYDNSDAVIIVYSCDSEESYTNIQKYWFSEVYRYLAKDGDVNVPILIVENKSDLEQGEIPCNFEVTKELAYQQNLLPPLQCSAKLGGEKVKKVFHVVATELYKRRQPRKPIVRGITHRSQERYRSITQTFYHNTSAVMIVFDVTDGSSYNAATTEWLRDVTTYLNPNQAGAPDIPILLVGNKIDLEDERVISARELKDCGKTNRLLLPVQCSAKSGAKVKQVFEMVAQEIIKRDLRPTPNIRPVESTKCCRQ